MKTASLSGLVLNGRKHCFPWTELAESPQNHLGSFLVDVNADVRVQQMPGFHHGPLRFCGLSFSHSAAVRSKSSSKSANRSNAANPWFHLFLARRSHPRAERFPPLRCST